MSRAGPIGGTSQAPSRRPSEVVSVTSRPPGSTVAAAGTGERSGK